jgi:serine/threonine protein kinase
MGSSKSRNFEPTVLDHYATTSYFLSKGTSGNVFGPIPWQGSQLAVKQVMFADGKFTDDFKKQIEVKKVIWTSLEHKNLMRILWVDLTRIPKVMYIVMDFAAGGSLHKTLRWLGSENKLPIDVVTNWAKQIADGMLYLHEKDIVHRDLKSSNILLMESFDAGNPHSALTLKIADFDEITEQNHSATMSALVGTIAYMAPEVLKHQLLSKASDIWSFGVVIWEMLSGVYPHKGLEPSAIMSKSISGELDNLPLAQSFPEEYKLLLSRCWESSHIERISIQGITIILQRIGDFSGHVCRFRKGSSQDFDSQSSVIARNFDYDFFNKYTTLSYCLSRGASSFVYGPIPWQGSQLAIKQAVFTDGKVTGDVKKRVREKNFIWTSLEHKNLIRIHWVDLNRLPKVMFIVMDYAAGGSLHKTLRWLGSENKLPIDVVTDWAKQIAEGMMCLHEKDIVHRDLKSSNILLMEPFRVRNPHVTLKITDFDEFNGYHSTETCAYMAPEVFKYQLFSKASKLLRARGGCLGVVGNAGVGGCEKSGGAAQRASIPECPPRPG